MAVPTNNFQNVATYQKGELAWMLNSFVGIHSSNKKFKDFNSLTANLGTSVTFDVTPRFISMNGLVITQQPSVQRFQTLTCSQAQNISTGYTDQQFVLNIQDYMTQFGKAAADELGTAVEADLLKNFVSGVVVNDPQDPSFGTAQTNSGPYRFFGNGVTPINSYQQLAQAVANFKNYGSAKGNQMGILPDVEIPAIIGTGLNQFAQKRNDKDAYSWELGPFADTEWSISNLLPQHVSGTIGNTASPNNVMTVVSTNDPTGANVTQITFSEPTVGTDANAVKAGDLFQFNDGVAGKPNMRFLTFVGHKPCKQHVQFMATADAATVAGAITVSVRTVNGKGIVWAQNADQNVNNAISAGMTVTPLPSHTSGILMSGNPLYLAMPKLPDYTPFPSSSMIDPDSGASIRHYYGNLFGQNNRAYVRDIIWGSTLIPEQSMRLVFPL